MKRMTRSERADGGAEDAPDGLEHESEAARPAMETWLLLARRGQVMAVYVDEVELSRAAWEADGDRIHLRTPIAHTAVTAAVRRGGVCSVVEAKGPRIHLTSRLTDVAKLPSA